MNSMQEHFKKLYLGYRDAFVCDDKEGSGESARALMAAEKQMTEFVDNLIVYVRAGIGTNRVESERNINLQRQLDTAALGEGLLTDYVKEKGLWEEYLLWIQLGKEAIETPLGIGWVKSALHNAWNDDKTEHRTFCFDDQKRLLQCLGRVGDIIKWQEIPREEWPEKSVTIFRYMWPEA